MAEWQFTYTIRAVDDNKVIKDLLTEWHIPKHLRKALAYRKTATKNGQWVSTAERVQTGDQLGVRFLAADFRSQDQRYPANNAEVVPVVYENADFLVVNKPAGMKMHPHSPTEHDTLLNYVTADLQARGVTVGGQPAAAYMVHRLDRGTSGGVVIAKHPLAVPVLNYFLRYKQIQRYYWALVSGELPAAAGTITAAIGVSPVNDRQRCIAGLNAQTAVTHWQRIQQTPAGTLVALQLDTGRMHQIRVHLASLGCPIIGDDLYQPDYSSGERLCLHSQTVILPELWQSSPALVTIKVPIAADFGN